MKIESPKVCPKCVSSMLLRGQRIKFERPLGSGTASRLIVYCHKVKSRFTAAEERIICLSVSSSSRVGLNTKQLKKSAYSLDVRECREFIRIP